MISMKKEISIPAKRDPVELADEMKRVIFRESLRRFRELEKLSC
jgi:hypothetical protein